MVCRWQESSLVQCGDQGPQEDAGWDRREREQANGEKFQDARSHTHIGSGDGTRRCRTPWPMAYDKYAIVLQSKYLTAQRGNSQPCSGVTVHISGYKRIQYTTISKIVGILCMHQHAK